ncbi:hypothetical protein YS110_06480 [Acidovorax sp. YS12]|nr:hypothetical protein YS110_06480 [Acidovorax sp. YS12]
MQKNPFLPLSHAVDWPAASRQLGLVAFAAGVGVWGALLLAPSPAAMPPALGVAAAQGTDTALVARWFGGGSSRLRVTVAGLMAHETGGAVLLAINGGLPQAYRVGQALAPGVTLAGIQADAVLIDQDGTVERLPTPARPAAVDGFIPAGPAPGNG